MTAANLPTSAIQATDTSPVRFDIIMRAFQTEGARPPLTVGTAPHMVGSLRGISRSLRTLDDNPTQPETHIAPRGVRFAGDGAAGIHVV